MTASELRASLKEREAFTEALTAERSLSDALAEALRDIASVIQPCFRCGGSGIDARDERHRSACGRCGGVGEDADAGPFLGNIRAALSRHTQARGQVTAPTPGACNGKPSDQDRCEVCGLLLRCRACGYTNGRTDTLCLECRITTDVCAKARGGAK